MEKVTFLTLKVTPNGLCLIALDPIFKSLIVGAQAVKVADKYQNTFIDISNELLEVLQKGEADFKAKEDK